MRVWLFWVLVEPFVELGRTLRHRTSTAARVLGEVVKWKVVDLLVGWDAPEALVAWLTADRAERAVMRCSRRLNGRLARAVGCVRLARLLGARAGAHEDVFELPIARRINASGRRVTISCVVQELSPRQAGLFPEEERARVAFSVGNAPGDASEPKGMFFGAVLEEPVSALACYYAEGRRLPLIPAAPKDAARGIHA